MSNYLSELTLPNGNEYLLKDAEARRDLLTKANSVDNEDYTEEYVKTFYSDATGCRIGYKIQLEPQQDLHGYEYPWVGGTGNNLVDLTQFGPSSANATVDVNGNELHATGNGGTTYLNVRIPLSKKTYSAGTYYVKFKVKENAVLTSYTRLVLRNSSGSQKGYVLITSDQTEYSSTMTIAEDCYLALMLNGNVTGEEYSSDITVYDLIVSTTDVPFEPYENICPITPYTEVNITRSWKNLYNENALSSIQVNEEGLMRGGFILSRPGTYTSSVVNAPDTNQYINIKHKKDGTFTNLYTYGSSYTDDFTFTINKGEVVTISVNSSSLETSKNVFASTQFQVEVGTHKTEYAIPYGETFTVTLPTEAGAVYSGTLSVNEDGSGEIIVDRLSTTFSDASWTRSVNNGLVSYKYVATGKKSGYGTVISSAYRTGTQTDSGEGTITGRISTTNVFIVDSRYDSTADWLNVVGNETLVYELENPVSYNLTAPQVTSLLGYNSIWNDAGPFVKLTYEGQIKQELDKKVEINNIVTDSTAARVKTLYDCADSMPMSIIAEINPVQDLHGQESPYPAGAGKNLFDAEHPSVTYSSGVTYVYNADGSITLSGTADSNATLFFFALPYEIPNGTGITWSLNNSSTNSEVGVRLVRRESGSIANWGTAAYADAVNKTLTVTPTGYNANEINVFVKTNHGDVPEITLKIQCEIGSEATEWTPYSNICPISGWDSVEITRTGKNLLKNDLVTTTRNNVNFTKNDDGTVTVAGTASANTSVDILGSSANPYKGFLTGSYIISKGNTNNNVRLSINMYNGTTWIKQTVAGASDNVEFEINYDGYDGVVVSLYVPNGANVNETVLPMIRYARETDATYEPYKGNVYSITWEDSAGTVYGGTVTINEDGSGKLIVDRKKVNVSDFNWTYVTSNKYFWTSIPEIKRGEANKIPALLKSDSYFADIPSNVPVSSGENGAMSVGISNPYLMVRDYRFTDATLFKQNANASIVYELASATEYPLTSQQITSLLGTNVVWNSIGTFSKVTHYSQVNSGYAVAIKSDNKVYTNENGIIDFDEFGAKKNYGSENAGKFLVVGSTGDVEAVSMNAWQGGSY